MLDSKYLIGIGITVVFVILYSFYLYRENYANGNDLAWAAGLPGNCSSCNNPDVSFDFSNPNLTGDTLVDTLKERPLDYYGNNRSPIYYGNALQDQLYTKVWR